MPGISTSQGISCRHVHNSCCISDHAEEKKALTPGYPVFFDVKPEMPFL